MSVIARFRRSVGLGAGTSPVREGAGADYASEAGPSSSPSSSSSSSSSLPSSSTETSTSRLHRSRSATSTSSAVPVLAYFVLENSSGTEKVRYPIRKRITKVGRLPSNDIRIYRETVSRLHCEVHVQDVKGENEDEGPGDRDIQVWLHIHNTRGVRINGQAPEQDSTRKSPVIVPLYEGDLIEIFRNFFRLRQFSTVHSYAPTASPGRHQSEARSSPLHSKPQHAKSPQSGVRTGRLPLTAIQPASQESGLAASTKRTSTFSSDIPSLRVLTLQSAVGVKGRGRHTTLFATPQRETQVQKNVPWSAEPVKAKAQKRVPSAELSSLLPAIDPPPPQEIPEAFANASDAHEDADGVTEKESEGGEQLYSTPLDPAPLLEDPQPSLGEDGLTEEKREDRPDSELEDGPVEGVCATGMPYDSPAPARQNNERLTKSVSPKKPRRRSTFFGRAGVFANWNFGFYPEERRRPSEGADDINEQQAPLSPPSTDPQPPTTPEPPLDENGRPRLPRSLSSPNLGRGSPKRRIVSLRTATLLRAGQNAFERQKLRSPPSSPTKSDTKPSLLGVLTSPLRRSPEEAEADSDDEDEVERSLSLVEDDAADEPVLADESSSQSASPRPESYSLNVQAGDGDGSEEDPQIMAPTNKDEAADRHEASLLGISMRSLPKDKMHNAEKTDEGIVQDDDDLGSRILSDSKAVLGGQLSSKLNACDGQPTAPEKPLCMLRKMVESSAELAALVDEAVENVSPKKHDISKSADGASAVNPVPKRNPMKDFTDLTGAHETHATKKGEQVALSSDMSSTSVSEDAKAQKSKRARGRKSEQPAQSTLLSTATSMPRRRNTMAGTGAQSAASEAHQSVPADDTFGPAQEALVHSPESRPSLAADGSLPAEEQRDCSTTSDNAAVGGILDNSTTKITPQPDLLNSPCLEGNVTAASSSRRRKTLSPRKKSASSSKQPSSRVAKRHTMTGEEAHKFALIAGSQRTLSALNDAAEDWLEPLALAPLPDEDHVKEEDKRSASAHEALLDLKSVRETEGDDTSEECFSPAPAEVEGRARKPRAAKAAAAAAIKASSPGKRVKSKTSASSLDEAHAGSEESEKRVGGLPDDDNDDKTSSPPPSSPCKRTKRGRAAVAAASDAKHVVGVAETPQAKAPKKKSRGKAKAAASDESRDLASSDTGAAARRKVLGSRGARSARSVKSSDPKDMSDVSTGGQVDQANNATGADAPAAKRTRGQRTATAAAPEAAPSSSSTKSCSASTPVEKLAPSSGRVTRSRAARGLV